MYPGYWPNPPNSSHRQTPGRTPSTSGQPEQLEDTRTEGFKLAFQSKKASMWISDQRGKRSLCGCWVLQRCPLMKGSVVLAGKEARPDRLGPLG